MEHWGQTVRRQLSECASGIESACQEAHRALDELFQTIARSLARQYGCIDEAADLAQEAHVKLAASKAQIAGNLPSQPEKVKAYLKVFAANAAKDALRRRGKERSVSLTDRMDDLAEHLRCPANLEREVLLRQFEDVLPKQDRASTIFRLYYQQGLTAQEIASIPYFQLEVKGVETALTRIRELIRRRTSR